ncbi:hypothetical protein V6N12_041896 [Hibiscus sabdariffa]|uniref:Protein kinase domain-containing protein n=1 Tax=Hibiscus sabdariffa TaxID=183260 RepID=A0ABR2EGU3_9ROSI
MESPPPPSLPPTTSFLPLYTPSPAHQRKPKTPSTPFWFFRRPFPPPSPAKHIRAVLRRRKPNKEAQNEAKIVEGEEKEEERIELDKRFGFSKELRIIPKSKMTIAITVEDVRREVKILRALTRHNNLVKLYDAFEDHDNVYIAMEFCEGGELLDKILARGGKYSEDDAKTVMAHILNVVAFCNLQGVVHRDLKPENFLYTSKEENSQLKAIDFGLSDFVRPSFYSSCSASSCSTSGILYISNAYGFSKRQT